MGYKIEVRTDIIDPHTYLDAELNYKELLEVINKCGGYVLFQQLYKWFGNKSKGFREIKKLEDLLLFGSEQLNNNKYVYLKSTALKYIKYKDVEKEVKETKVNRLLQKPGFRPIMNSVYSFQYLLEKKESINEESSLKAFEMFVSKAREVFNKDKFTNLHLGKIVKNEYVQQLIIKLKILGDRNGIFLKNYIPEAEFSKSKLEFVWFDFDQNLGENPVLKTLQLISKFLNNVGTTGKNNLFNCCKFSLEIITISEERKKVIEQLSEMAIENIDKKNSFHLKSSIRAKAIHVISNLEEIKYVVFVEIEGYLKISTKGDNEFNFINNIVVDRLEELKNHLKGEGK
ncbi:hypothetical protein [Clostridium lacusfryxellense]|uniref:hypothetical protein n=1 Tax=Clostridium lacusfryxellense TaxID=205328 RepID=UPI001C0C0521|nr:hypothetical protein [Clostridium lacusfryxellense]MBU3114742.1 hypothetical protein [Clostridium lacusfryxellense]